MCKRCLILILFLPHPTVVRNERNMIIETLIDALPSSFLIFYRHLRLVVAVALLFVLRVCDATLRQPTVSLCPMGE